MNSHALGLPLSFLAGILIGTVFFGGLWWTIRAMLSAQVPAAWFAGSLLLRTIFTLAGFYLVCGAHLDRTAACLFGFLVARFIVVRATRGTGLPLAVAHAP